MARPRASVTRRPMPSTLLCSTARIGFGPGGNDGNSLNPMGCQNRAAITHLLACLLGREELPADSTCTNALACSAAMGWHWITSCLPLHRGAGQSRRWRAQRTASAHWATATAGTNPSRAVGGKPGVGRSRLCIKAPGLLPGLLPSDAPQKVSPRPLQGRLHPLAQLRLLRRSRRAGRQ